MKRRAPSTSQLSFDFAALEAVELQSKPVTFRISKAAMTREILTDAPNTSTDDITAVVAGMETLAKAEPELLEQLGERRSQTIHRLCQLSSSSGSQGPFLSDLSPAIAFVEAMGSMAAAQQAVEKLERICQLVK